MTVSVAISKLRSWTSEMFFSSLCMSQHFPYCLKMYLEPLMHYKFRNKLKSWFLRTGDESRNHVSSSRHYILSPASVKLLLFFCKVWCPSSMHLSVTGLLPWRFLGEILSFLWSYAHCLLQTFWRVMKIAFEKQESGNAIASGSITVYVLYL